MMSPAHGGRGVCNLAVKVWSINDGRGLVKKKLYKILYKYIDKFNMMVYYFRMLRTFTQPKEVGMDVVLVSHVRRLCNAKGWSDRYFVGKMIAEAGVSEGTAKRIYEGETNITAINAAKVATILGVKSIGEIIEIKLPSKK